MRASPRLLSVVALALLSLGLLGLGCPACEDLCRNDQDCALEKNLVKCVKNVCVAGAAPPEEGAGCAGADASGCPGGQANAACIDAHCVVAPRCQLLKLSSFPGLARLNGAESDVVASTTAGAGCAFAIAFNVAGHAAVIDVSRIDLDGTIHVVGDACDRASFHADRSVAQLRACTTNAGSVDLVLAPQGARACFANDVRCAPADCPPLTAGENGGLCR